MHESVAQWVASHFVFELCHITKIAWLNRTKRESWDVLTALCLVKFGVGGSRPMCFKLVYVNILTNGKFNRIPAAFDGYHSPLIETQQMRKDSRDLFPVHFQVLR